MDKLQLTAFILSAVLLAGTAMFVLDQRPPTPLPDFSIHEDVKAKKAHFFSYLTPFIDLANARIAEDRLVLEHIYGRFLDAGTLHWLERARLVKLVGPYAIETGQAVSDAELVAEAMLRVNIVPAPLVLIQAAKESAWGTSKFAVQGNNLFGQQCFDKGCGFIPTARDVGRRHEVAAFPSVQAAVDAYLFNLNTHPRYADMREIRLEMELTGNELTGTRLADGLLAYSERRQAYVDEVKAMIRQNRLE